MWSNKSVECGGEIDCNNAQKEENEGYDGKPRRFVPSPPDGQSLVQ